METNIHSNASSQLHVLFGSGGTKAILAGTGAVLAFRLAGLTEWQSIGGASGGSIPAALLASHLEPAEFLRQVVETDFDRLMVPHKSVLGRLYAVARKYHYEHTRPAKGAYGTDLFKEFIDSTVSTWPDRFWTVAACGHGQVLFTKTGVYKYPATRYGATPSAPGLLMSKEPPSLGLAVIASCAIPGILDAVKYGDEYLVDGALSGDGDCPIAVIPRHFGATPNDVVAVDVGEDSIKKSWWLQLLWQIGCGGKCKDTIAGRHAEDGDARLVIIPRIDGFHALQFTLSRDLKWKAVIGGFVETAKALAESDLIPQESKDRVLSFADQLSAIEAEGNKDRKLACKIESFLSEHGLYRAHSCEK